MIEPGQFRVVIRDMGQGFKPEKVPSPLDEDRILRKTGRGIFMTKNVIYDNLEYNQTPEGLEAILTKNFSKAA